MFIVSLNTYKMCVCVCVCLKRGKERAREMERDRNKKELFIPKINNICI